MFTVTIPSNFRVRNWGSHPSPAAHISCQQLPSVLSVGCKCRARLFDPGPFCGLPPSSCPTTPPLALRCVRMDSFQLICCSLVAQTLMVSAILRRQIWMVKLT